MEVHIEIDAQTSKLTAIASGSTEVKAQDLMAECSEEEAYAIAAEDMKTSADAIEITADNANFRVFQPKETGGARAVRIVDRKGFIKAQRADAKAAATRVTGYRAVVTEMWEDLAVYKADAILQPDYGWYAFSRELLTDKFSDDAQHGALMPERAAAHLGVRIAFFDTAADSAQVLFATFTEPDLITVYRDVVCRGETLLQEQEAAEALPHLDITRVLLWHELFHAVELRKKDTIFTQTEKIALWRGPFQNRSTIRCLGEIAAMAFAAEMERLPYSPYCLGVLLVYGYDARAASALYDEMKQVLSSHVDDADGKTEEDASC